MDLKETQQNLLELMIAFDGICRQQKLSYSLYGGTLLGAVREKGFISWDDDMDIIMSRREFEKLENALVGHPRFHIVGNIKKQFRQKGDNRFWVDIFICDYIDRRRLPQKLKQLMLTMLDVMNRDKHTIALSDFSKYGTGKRIAFKAAYWVGKLLTTKLKAKLYRKVSRDFWTGDRTLCIRSNDQYKGRILTFPSAWLDRFQHVPFLHTSFSVTTRYHDVLVSIYGEEYMTPQKEDRNSLVHDMVRSDREINF